MGNSRNALVGVITVLLLGGCGSSRMVDSPSAATSDTAESERAAEAHDAAELPPAAPVPDAAETPRVAELDAEDAAQASSPVDFQARIRPILERCQPCHFEGGKMYAQLPFDSPKTVRTLGERLFTRIQDPAEQATIRAFLAQPESSDQGE